MQKIILITGVCGGIGITTANLFKKNGCLVIGVDEKDTKSELNGIDYFFSGDVSEKQLWERIKNEINHKFGYLDALINNAAIQICKPLIETSLEDWDRVMAVNLRSVYLSARSMFSLLKERDSAIVNISSVHAKATSENIAAYATSKGGMLALTRSMAIEFAPYKIRVNCLLPGAVDTSMLHSGLSRTNLSEGNIKKSLKRLSQKTIIGRIGQAQEISEAILFLSDYSRSSFICGQGLVIDGGALAKLSTE